MSDFQVVLLGNYAPMRQQSMLRFAELLQHGWRRRGVEAQLVQPAPHWAAHAPAAVRKWAAYVDQYARFPRRAAELARQSGWDERQPTVFHICDHSNSIYLRGLRGRRVVLTCHDLLAVRGARGEPTYCPASPTGRILQGLILSYLRRTPWVACDSHATREDFLRLTGRPNDGHVTTIPLSLNAPFAPVSEEESKTQLAKFSGLLEKPYVLHVGSGLLRKNRAGVLRAVAQARPRWSGRVVFAGEPLHEYERAAARDAGLPAEDIFEISDASHDALAALYSRAHAMVFPSFCEGYGWPVLEAQACGCPVICSNVTSLPEIAGDSAMLFAPDDARGQADAIVTLADPSARARCHAAGLANAARFGEDRMFEAYRQLYQRALA
ncbi:MAG TPA: glycosyltransferase family 1 protein [Opitutales bacterium]|nr:glycosyltransferase family 1 protein [Opitutales bacterium]